MGPSATVQQQRTAGNESQTPNLRQKNNHRNIRQEVQDGCNKGEKREQIENETIIERKQKIEKLIS